MSKLRLYGATSGYEDIKTADTGDNTTYQVGSTVTSVNVTASGTVSSANVTASDTVTDSKGDVREVNRNIINSTPYAIPSGSSGEIFECRSGSGTVNINSANFALGDIVTVYNHQGSTVTITFDTFSNSARIAGDTTNYSGTSITLATYGIATFICTNNGRIVVNGNVS